MSLPRTLSGPGPSSRHSKQDDGHNSRFSGTPTMGSPSLGFQPPGSPMGPRPGEGGVDDGWNVMNSPRNYKPGTKEKVEKLGTPFSSIVAICATAMGAGILSLPEAISRCGVVMGLSIIVFFGVLADFSLVFLIECSRASGRRSFEGVSTHFLGRSGAYAIKMSLVLLLFFSLILLLIVAGKLFGTPLRYFWSSHADEWYLQNVNVSLFSAIAILPLSMVRQISFLKYTSFFGTLFVVYIVVVLVIKMGQSRVDPSWVPYVWHEDSFLAVPVIMSAFCCQFNIFKIDFELKPEYKRHINSIIHVACATITLTYCLGGGIGYLLMGQDIKNQENPDDLLSMFPGDYKFLIGSGLVGLTNLLKIPLIVLPFRVVAMETIGREESKASFVTILVMTTVTVAICAGIAVGLKSISKVLGLIGSTAGVVVVLILPGALYLQGTSGVTKWDGDTKLKDPLISADSDIGDEESRGETEGELQGKGKNLASSQKRSKLPATKWVPLKRFVAWVMVVVGVVGGIGSLGLTIALWNES